jgi:hypothetical protein
LNGGHPLRGWRRSIEKVLALEPDWILASHMQPVPYRRDDVRAMRQWTEDVTAGMTALAPDGCLERHHTPHVVSLEPYAQEAASSATIHARIMNPYPHRVEIACRLVLPNGWEARPEADTAVIAPGDAAEIAFTVGLPEPVPSATMVTLDLTYDGEYWGEKAECYLYSRKE